MAPIADHPQRFRMTSELHARPFPVVCAPAMVAYLAVKSTSEPANREESLAQLAALLEHYGAPGPEQGATHYAGPIGKYQLKWEQHTEFATYTVFLSGLSDRPFDPATFEVFPTQWQDALPQERITSGLLRIMTRPKTDAEIQPSLKDWFVAESLAAASVLDDAAVIASDFRVDSAGHLRFAVFVSPGTGKRRVGRIVQRLCEIDTYKTMSMLGFVTVRNIADELNALDTQLRELTATMRGSTSRVEETLHQLLDVSVSLEQLDAATSYRFAATAAYEALVNQRISVLREARFLGRQGFGEFMMRRFEPAMRTVNASQTRLKAMSERSIRASDLLRTRVDVERSAQNQEILASMDRRSDLQLRLQRTVEGLSVVAVSYYAVSLMAYLIAPASVPLGMPKAVLTALITLPVVALVWWFLRRLRRADD
ncbi:DUF3422 domain-containing protein [Sulfitobacter sp. TSTF-M16]|uniref:DUF3422 domain-containing protein n=1 Tax=Sulfitobacter aestuariivivens TaxID=2766981 RepID=A0A927HEQ0_9RHOB|nr:DUF3422 domain-containing protein [Sulfitobacter aestuariivivens]MBD3663608.1 DUF3422 domain-containing protein [Sulfitobacter aestuariivivens]